VEAEAAMTTAVSAPGKVLLAGGYLVLDREFTGLVFGLGARIHVCVHPLRASSGVVVTSPQFRDARWEYGYRVAEQGGGIEVTQLGRQVDFTFAEGWPEAIVDVEIFDVHGHGHDPRIPEIFKCATCISDAVNI